MAMMLSLRTCRKPWMSSITKVLPVLPGKSKTSCWGKYKQQKCRWEGGGICLKVGKGVGMWKIAIFDWWGVANFERSVSLAVKEDIQGKIAPTIILLSIYCCYLFKVEVELHTSSRRVFLSTCCLGCIARCTQSSRTWRIQNLNMDHWTYWSGSPSRLKVGMLLLGNHYWGATNIFWNSYECTWWMYHDTTSKVLSLAHHYAGQKTVLLSTCVSSIKLVLDMSAKKLSHSAWSFQHLKPFMILENYSTVHHSPHKCLQSFGAFEVEQQRPMVNISSFRGLTEYNLLPTCPLFLWNSTAVVKYLYCIFHSLWSNVCWRPGRPAFCNCIQSKVLQIVNILQIARVHIYICLNPLRMICNRSLFSAGCSYQPSTEHKPWWIIRGTFLCSTGSLLSTILNSKNLHRVLKLTRKMHPRNVWFHHTVDDLVRQLTLQFLCHWLCKITPKELYTPNCNINRSTFKWEAQRLAKLHCLTQPKSCSLAVYMPRILFELIFLLVPGLQLWNIACIPHSSCLQWSTILFEIGLENISDIHIISCKLQNESSADHTMCEMVG